MSDRINASDGKTSDDPSAGAIGEAMRRGDITGEQAAEQLRQAARRQIAEHGPTEDTDGDGTITEGGFGSGQGMGTQRTGQ